jgi:hypothetical protein
VGEGVASTAVIGPPLTSLPGGYPSATPPPTPQGNPADTITLTQSDNGGTVRLRVGQTLLLYLNPPGGPTLIWTVTIADETVIGRMKASLPAAGLFHRPQAWPNGADGRRRFPCGPRRPAAPAMLFQVQIVGG